MTLKKEQLKKLYLDNKLICNCIILAVLFFINCFWGEFAYISFATLALMVGFADTKEGFSLLVACVPFFCIKMSISMILFCACLMIFLVKAHIRMYVKDKVKPNKVILVIFALFLVYCLIPFGPYGVDYLIKFVATFCILGIINVFSVYPGDMRLRFNLVLLSMGLLVATVYCLTYFVSPYLQDNLVILGEHDFIRFAALFDNPLNLSRICEICLSMQMYFILSKHHKLTWVDPVSMVIYLMLGISTISKASLILFAIMGVILVCYAFKQSPFKTLLFITFAAIIVLIVVLAFNEFIMTYAGRFVGEDFASLDINEKLNVITTDRWDLWTDYVRYLSEHPVVLLFGAGFGAGKISVMSAHNFYLTVLYQFGIVGGALFVTTFVVFIRKFLKNYPGKISKAIWVPLAILLLIMCVEDFFLFIY